MRDLHTIHEPEMLEPLVEAHNKELAARSRIMIQSDSVDRRTRLFRTASDHPFCKAYVHVLPRAKMINELERQMGYEIVTRKC